MANNKQRPDPIAFFKRLFEERKNRMQQARNNVEALSINPSENAEALPINPPRWTDKGWGVPEKPGTAIPWRPTKPSNNPPPVKWPTGEESTPKNAPSINPNARPLSKEEASKFLGNINRKGGSIKSKPKKK